MVESSGLTARLAITARYHKENIRKTFLQHHRILAYCGVITGCSLLSLSEDYKIDKRNLLNQWFVKIGWFWTNAFVLPLLFLTIKTDDRESVLKALLRVFVSSFLWYTSVNLFQYIDTATGFDISGHTFLLMFSNLIISSELKLVDKLKAASASEKSSQSGDKRARSEDAEQRLFIAKGTLLILSALWDFMLLQTALFYHTLIQKMIAAIWAMASWYILHVVFYHKSQ